MHEGLHEEILLYQLRLFNSCIFLSIFTVACLMRKIRGSHDFLLHIDEKINYPYILMYRYTDHKYKARLNAFLMSSKKISPGSGHSLATATVWPCASLVHYNFRQFLYPIFPNHEFCD